MPHPMTTVERAGKLTEAQRKALREFVAALGEWGCENPDEEADAIADFIDGDFDLSGYQERSCYRDPPPRLTVIEGGRAALGEAE